jgi:hypothetical protein
LRAEVPEIYGFAPVGMQAEVLRPLRTAAKVQGFLYPGGGLGKKSTNRRLLSLPEPLFRTQRVSTRLSLSLTFKRCPFARALSNALAGR